ncbi:nonstructural protein [Rotavirus C]|uniref:Non-structural protein 5 n=1 Tax=Rotavirus C TaxID=36427 RepID=A0A0S2XGP0_9REOV|nr:nonstructural protein [Rotavirus C]
MSDFGINLDAICDNVKKSKTESRTGSQLSNRSSRRMDFVDDEELSTYFNSKASVTQSDSCSNDLAMKHSIITEAVVCDESAHVSADAIQEKDETVPQTDHRIMKWMLDSHDGVSLNGGINFTRAKNKMKETENEITEMKSKTNLLVNASVDINSNIGTFSPINQKVKTEAVLDMFEAADIEGCICKNCPYREKYRKLRSRMKNVLIDMINEM